MNSTVSDGDEPHRNLTTHYVYDPWGRPLSVQEGSTRKTVTEYNDAGRRVITRSDVASFEDVDLHPANTAITVQYYDQLGRPIRAWTLENGDLSSARSDSQTQGIFVDTVYLSDNAYTYELVSNPYDKLMAEPDTQGWTVTTRDSAGRVIAVETFHDATQPTLVTIGSHANSTGVITTSYPSYTGNTTIVTDQSNVTRTSAVDALGRLSSVTDNTGTTSYHYDALDNLAKVTQGSQTRTFKYDSLGRLKSVLQPEAITPANPTGLALTNTYDAGGNLHTRTDARGVITTYSYDGRGRITDKTYNDGTPAVHYTYDDTNVPKSWGRLTQVASTASTYNYTAYNEVGGVLSSSQSTTGLSDLRCPFTYSYNAAGSLTSIQYPSCRVVNYAYDTIGRLIWVAGSMNGGPTAYAGSSTDSTKRISYYAHGALRSASLGYGATETTTYNSQLQMAGRTVTKGTLLLGITNNYLATQGCNAGLPNCNNGNLRSQTIWPLNVMQTYAYDAVNRLGNATEPSVWTRTYGYDQYGNNWVSNSPSPGLPTDASIPTASSWFDTNTNRLILAGSQPYDANGNQQYVGPFTLTYDAENRQTSATSQMNGSVQYSYDGDGHRIKMVSAGVTTVFVYDAMGNLAGEYSDAASDEPGTRYVTTDQLGSIRMTTVDGDPGNTRRFDYEPFGKELSTSNRTLGSVKK